MGMVSALPKGNLGGSTTRRAVSLIRVDRDSNKIDYIMVPAPDWIYSPAKHGVVGSNCPDIAYQPPRCPLTWLFRMLWTHQKAVRAQMTLASLGSIYVCPPPNLDFGRSLTVLSLFRKDQKLLLRLAATLLFRYYGPERSIAWSINPKFRRQWGLEWKMCSGVVQQLGPPKFTLSS